MNSVAQAVAGSLPGGGSVEQVLETADELSCFPGVELVEDGVPGRPARFTTRELLAIEREALELALAGRDADPPRPDRKLLLRTLIRADGLSNEQRQLVLDASASPDRVVCVVGVAGAGKTTALRVLADAHRESEIVVLGVAPSGRAADELQAATGIPSRTLHRLLKDARHHGLPRGCVLVVDEAGMAETRVLAPVLRLVEKAEGKALLVGDPGQLPSVGAGGLYPALCKQLGAIELTANRRQRDPLEQEGLARLRAGDPEPYLAHAARHGRFAIDDDPATAKQRLLADWWERARRDRARTVMLAYRRDDVRDLNQAARALMLQSGRLGNDSVTLGEREFRAGDQVLCRQNDARLGVRNGTRGTIVDLDHATLTLRDDSGVRRSLPLDYAEEHLDYGYALTGHAAQGATVDRTYVFLHDQGALQEWGYVACTRARAEARLYLASGDAIGRETPMREPDPTGPPERAARALERPAAEPLALNQTRQRHDLHARLHAGRQEELERQRARAAEQLATAQRELKQFGWWSRSSRRFELQMEIALGQTALRGIDEKRAERERTPQPTPRMPPVARDGDELTPSRSRRPEPPGRRTIEREPPSLGLEL